ncbi:succinylglutamate desuccinylase/aspartoacylase family protein [Paraburkholderia caribensis]|uniref:succinylglutamate desuccinylase/aspartoacylase family protein n=1 Tax=Paraburkholderia caribensis TaxID=75105 RepID=UPI00072188D8|nr:succinylglutamate desuccinylase/aspartoacylase family protein [Paraburkholderia caribensis]ALP68080.1 deacylase [Paraburkholderia caribensis]AUT56293.1 deacylase [Paraburkholderia caribensis]
MNPIRNPRNPVRSEIDFDAQGKHSGYLRLPHSVHRSAYGWLPIPIASIRNAAGPVVLVMAGNHGDEYEGQILVSELIRQLDADDVSGQLILLPTANAPAAEAGLRTSPLDDGNLNRAFPGDPSGSPTQIIAHYIEHELLARADFLLDLHSGGSSLLYHGNNMLAIDPRDEEERRQLVQALQAFGLPNAFLHAENPVHAASAARRQGALSITAEIGGGGAVNPLLLDEARRGLLHFLAHIGVLSGPLVPDAPPAVTRFLRVAGAQHYVYAYDSGIYEPLVELGQRVRAGQPAARIHFPDTPLKEPVTCHFASDGEVVCKRVPALVKRGDCLFHLADEDRSYV